MPDPTRKFLDDLHKQLNTLEKRLRYLETFETGGTRMFMVHNNAYLLDNVTINKGNTNTTGDVRGSYGVASNATGVVLMVEGLSSAAQGYLLVDSADVPDVYSPYLRFPASTRVGGMLLVALNAAGEISFSAVGPNISRIYCAVIGYWI